jgi:type II secretory ATPase GspE/PulE/Tfp pilus assembly ATPase PilB-like protein
LEDGKVRLSVDLEGLSAVNIFDTLCKKALAAGVSDIHGEPFADFFRIRFRIDGVLYEITHLANERAQALVSRIKILAGIDISERRLPQDGQCTFEYYLPNSSMRAIDVRVATFPTVYGEKFTLRLLDTERGKLTLEQTGVSTIHMQKLLHYFNQQQGFILVCGPTGSGKTTTLYAALSRMHTIERHIVTLEDPVEYMVEGVVQASVVPKIGFTFAKGIRAILRHDPDVIMVGEIRDAETADAAIAAALTGHLVLSTTHTATALGSLLRLFDMGIEPYVLTASLSCVLAQRLVRRLCSYCREEYVLSAEERTIIAGDVPKKVFQKKGCEKCFGTGYHGRIGIFELLEITEDLRAAIGKRAFMKELKYVAERSGFRPFSADAYTKVEDGLISFSEYISLLSM